MAASAQTPENRRQVERVLIITLVLNLLVAGGKIVIGLLTGALAITADGFHSVIDGTGNVLGLIANRIAGRPADENHPFGHRRVETLAALAIGVLLLVTAFEVVTNAIDRLFSGAVPEVSPLSFVILIVTLIINAFVAYFPRRAGVRLHSEILVADSANTSSDVFVTLSVLGSIVLTALGLHWADPAVALLIVVLIARAAFKILRSTSSVLTDRAPLPSQAVAAAAAQVPAVSDSVVRARTRGSPDAIYVDVDVAVPPETTTERAAAIADAIREQVHAQFTGITEVEVHFEPLRDGPPDYALAARACADRLGLATHAVHVTTMDDGRQRLELHVEVPGEASLAQAHQQATALERELHEAYPELGDIITHIEPVEKPVPAHGSPEHLDALRAQARSVLEREHPQARWHALTIVPANGGCALSAHAGLPAETSLEAAHLLADAAERTLRDAMPEVQRVTIHTEPEDAP